MKVKNQKKGPVNWVYAIKSLMPQFFRAYLFPSVCPSLLLEVAIMLRLTKKRSVEGFELMGKLLIGIVIWYILSFYG